MLGNMSQEPLLISGILNHAEQFNGDVPVVSRKNDGSIEESNWRDIALSAKQVANGLKALGLEQGDRVATLSWNTVNHLEVYFGISCSGLVLHTINPRLFADQIVYIANHGGAKVVILDTDFLPVIEQIADQLTEVEHFIIFDTKEQVPSSSIENLLYYNEFKNQYDPAFSWPVIDENSASSLCYTSGTTGNPKGVLYSHRTTVIHSMAVCAPNLMNISKLSAILPVVPMFHVNAWGIPYAAAMSGAALVLPGKMMDGASLSELILTYKVTDMLGVPTVWLNLLNYADENDVVFSTVNRVFVGGSAAPASMIEKFDVKHNTNLMHLWGMTEMSPMGTINDINPHLLSMSDSDKYQYLTKQGRPPYGVQIRIVDDEGNVLPHDGKTFGQLQVKGIWILNSYYKKDEAAVDSDGWFNTGDVSNIDATGNMTIVDRAKDVIKSGGEWISSIEIENIAVGMQGVVEACVIGVSHPKWDERPLLLIIKQENSDLDKEAMLQFLSGKIANWWMPDDVIFVTELPHTATGKLQKNKLRDIYLQHLSS